MTIKLTQVETQAIVRMAATPGHIVPWDYAPSTLSKFKKQGIIEAFRLAKDGRGIMFDSKEKGSVIRYRLTTEGRSVAQMASAS